MRHLRSSIYAITALGRGICFQQHQQLLQVQSAGPTLIFACKAHQACQQPWKYRQSCQSLATLAVQQPHVQQPCQHAQQQHTVCTHGCSSSRSAHHISNRQQRLWQQQQQQQQHFLQQRHYATDDAAKRRLLAAQQRRERHKELEERRAAAAANSPLQEQGAAPPPAPFVGDAVAPVASQLSEAQISTVVNHQALIVTRAIEWGTLVLGFEQATKYTVYDQDGNVVALIAEETSGIGNEIQRQLLRTRRSFTSTVLSADGSQVVFRVRRPAYLINSYMYIEDPQGEVLGEVRQRWHLWRRNYDLYIGKRQFAAINGGFLAWEFELKDAQGNTLALIDRNFLGFAREIFTDAGKYVVHFGYSPQAAAELCTRTIQARSGKDDVAVTPLAQARTEVAVIPSVTGNQLVVQHPLPLEERLIALAAAISVDYNYFSPHSQSGGLISPPLFMPVPLPGGGEGGAGGAAEGAATGGAAATSTAAAGTEAAPGASGAAAQPSGPSLDQQPLGAPGFSGDEGFSSGLGASEQTPSPPGFGDDAESFRWDMGGGDAAGGGGLGGDEDSSSGLWGIIASIWAMIFVE